MITIANIIISPMFLLGGCPSDIKSTIEGPIVERDATCSRWSYECSVVIEGEKGVLTHKDLPWKEWNNCPIGARFPGCANAVKGTRPRPN